MKPVLYTNQLMRTYFITSASSTVVTQFQLKCVTYDIKWKFPNMTMLHTFLFHVGEYTGYPVAHLRLTQEEGREEMWRHVFRHEGSSGSSPLPRDIICHLRFLCKTCRKI